MEESTRNHLDRYLCEPSPENFALLRDAVAASADYDPYNNYQQTAYPLLEQEKLEEGLEYLMSKMPGWVLNPGIHKLVSFALHKLGREQEAQFEYALAEMLLDALLASGDGSETHPYLVLYVADEYDVLAHLDKKPQTQRLVEKDDKWYDTHVCEDGSQIWFDIAVPHAHLQRQFQSENS